MGQILPPAKLLLIFIDDTDTWGDERIPLYEAIVEVLFELRIAGATVQHGIMGFGTNRRLHRKRLFGVTDERPVTISVIENEGKLRAALPRIQGMVREGVVFLLDGEIAHQGVSQASEGRSAE